MKTALSRKFDLHAMSVDELWQLHKEIAKHLSLRLTSKKRQLERRLAELGRHNEITAAEPTHAASLQNMTRQRRKYPRVLPKYRNPNDPTETWSGRGKQPRWLTAALQMGSNLEEFVIGTCEGERALGAQTQI